MPPEEVARIRRELGYDQPLPIQLVRYVGRLLQGDFGRSSTYRQPAFPLIVERLPATLYLAAAAMLINLVIALPLGIISAVRRGGAVDVFGTVLVFAGQSMPVFWMGIMLILLFSLTLQLLPASGYGWLERHHAGLRARRPRRRLPDPFAAIGDAGRHEPGLPANRPRQGPATSRPSSSGTPCATP